MYKYAFLMIVLVLPFTMVSQTDYSPGFSAGTPIEMDQLLFLKGEWEIELKWTNNTTLPREEWLSAGKSKSNISDYYDGTFLHEKSLGFPLGNEGHEGFKYWSYNSIFSYDRFNAMYRYVALDNIMGLADIYEGNFVENKLVLTNAGTNTYNNQGTNGTNQKNRLILNIISDDIFEITWENIDEDQLNLKDVRNSDWNFVILMVYKRVSQ